MGRLNWFNLKNIQIRRIQGETFSKHREYPMELMGVDKAIEVAKIPNFEVSISREKKKTICITLLYFKQKLGGHL